ncbi:nose resistant to fluoxetine protein 6-like isoform X2 [Zerene cesonia]|uniref:nose resistant to fluoxetine protein 6-like isoform X2 n=1 Tax=Zerene cesonia TaxID=33412 RepID=UPI0018E57A74|nr:nose resistant to fluoxetine protein 6-like isoform X2 [Zerene cesonia]
MLRTAVILIILLNFIVAYCSVLVPVKTIDSPSIPVGEKHVVPESKGNGKNVLQKTFLFNGSYVYLEDVLFVLKNQNWTEEEQPCLKRTVSLLRNLQNFTLWAAWNWDSIASEPQGLLYGSRFHLGNYDECMDAPWYKDHEELRSQYCLADIVLERTDKAVKKRAHDPYDPYQSALNLLEHQSYFLRPLNRLTWGMCVPDICQKESVARLMGILLAHSHLGAAGLKANVAVNSCDKANEPVHYDALFYAFFLVFGALTVISVVCTLLNKKDLNKRILIITKAFDLKDNALDLLKIKKEGIEVLYGIRFFTMVIIVINHQFGITNGGPISNGYRVDEDIVSFIGMFLLHDDVMVDSFFWLSGFLTANIITKVKGSLNLPVFLLRRYVRLAVAYAVTIFYICSVYPYSGSGPLWKKAISQDTDQCRKNWWASLLMISNYFDTENICLVVSWYIPCDFHFFVVTLLAYWLYKNNKLTGQIAAVLLSVAAIMSPGIVNYLYNLPPIQLFTFDFISNPRGQKQFHLTYIKSHTRFAAYLIGFFSGYIFVRYYTMKNKRISQKWSLIGMLTGITLMIAVLFSGPPYLWRQYTVLESAIYAALNRPVWACGISFIVLSCAFGNVPLIKSFFCWHAWVPLSRLAYGLYLTHSLIIARNVYVTRNMQHNDYVTMLTMSGGVVVEGLIASFLIWILVEAPINNLLAVCLLPRREPSTTEEKNEQNQGHLQDNLPPVVQIDSSKV